MSDKPKKMNLVLKLHLLIVLPLLIVSGAVTIFTHMGLKENASALTNALQVNAEATKILPLLLTQDDASKAMLIDPSALMEFSGKKLAAYDQLTTILKNLNETIEDPIIRDLIAELSAMDQNTLRPIDTKILETTFMDIDKARKMYFAEYEPKRLEFEKKIRELGDLGREKADQARGVMTSRNETSLLQIVAALFLGISLISVTIVIMSRQIERAENNMLRLLGGLEEGLLFFDKDGHIALERSGALESILPGSLGITDLETMAEKFTKTSAANIKSCLGLLWSDDDDGFMSDFDTSVTMLPQKTSMIVEDEKRDITFSYKALNDKHGNLDKVLVIVHDVTETLRNEKEAKAQAQRVRRISKAAGDTDSFSNFLTEAIGIFKSADHEMQSLEPDMLQLKRDLHTIKGSVGTFEFGEVADAVHLLEDKIIEAGVLDESSRGLWLDIKNKWKSQTGDIEEVLALKADAGLVKVKKDKLEKIWKYGKTREDRDLLQMVHALTRHPVSKVFGKYVDYLANLNERDPDKDVKVAFAPDCDEISYGEAQALDGALIHIFRNCFDHGIESCEKRQHSGKSSTGTIQVAFYRKVDASLHCLIKDDGGGIDGDRLALKAVDAGIWTREQMQAASAQEKVNLIFAPNLSSKDQASSLSGRGVGMDAVKQIVEGLGGSISVVSEMGTGTQFKIDVPKAGLVAATKAAA